MADALPSSTCDTHVHPDRSATTISADIQRTQIASGDALEGTPNPDCQHPQWSGERSGSATVTLDTKNRIRPLLWGCHVGLVLSPKPFSLITEIWDFSHPEGAFSAGLLVLNPRLSQADWMVTLHQDS